MRVGSGVRQGHGAGPRVQPLAAVHQRHDHGDRGARIVGRIGEGNCPRRKGRARPQRLRKPQRRQTSAAVTHHQLADALSTFPPASVTELKITLA
jgi:hypothetical protein